MKITRFLILLIIVLFLFSCSKKILVKDYSKVKINENTFEYLSARAKITIQNNDQSISGIASIRMKKDSVIWISVSPGLGIEVARILIDKNGIQIINKLNKEYSIKNFDELSKTYNLKLNFNIIEALLVGNLILPYKNEKFDKNDEILTFNQSLGNLEITNEINNQNKKLQKLLIKEKNRKNSLTVDFGSFNTIETTENDKLYPYIINADLQYIVAEKTFTQKVNIEFNKIVIKDKNLKFPFDVFSNK